MKKIQIKNRFNNKVLFEYECKDNTIKKTVIEAISSSADLSSANLSSANLRSANLRSANLRSANLRYADLRSADLRSADLRSADLSSANLSSADLRYADLSSADLSSANLSSANLRSANLSSANLSSADLRSANLRYADLRSANLRYADLRSADINKIKHLFCNIPEEGSFIAWKKGANNTLIKLQIPAKAKRVSPIVGRKCRAEFAKVLQIWDNEGNKINKCSGWYNSDFIYERGKIIKPDQFDNSPLVECSNGIHFFITKQEAIEF